MQSVNCLERGIRMTFKHSAEKVISVLSRIRDEETSYDVIAREEGVSVKEIDVWENKIDEAGAECTTGMSHRFFVEQPNGPLAYGVCRNCQAVNVYQNAQAEHGYWAGKGKVASKIAAEQRKEKRRRRLLKGLIRKTR